MNIIKYTSLKVRYIAKTFWLIITLEIQNYYIAIMCCNFDGS